MKIRPMAVADQFYPNNAQAITHACQAWIPEDFKPGTQTKAVIVPHAGYVYSGQGACVGLAALANHQPPFTTLVIFGPAHRVPFAGVSALSLDALQTPFGLLEEDKNLLEEVMAKFPLVQINDFAQAQEHSVEVQLPLIHYHFGAEIKVVSLVVGQMPGQQLAPLIAYLWQHEGVGLVFSSDLSHYHPYEKAQHIDAQTAQLIEQGRWQALNGERACGYKAIQGLLALKDQLHFQVKPLMRYNSGDTAGDKKAVVGYGTWAIEAVKDA